MAGSAAGRAGDARPDNPGALAPGGRTLPRVEAQRRTALWSVFAALALIALKLGTGLATHSLGLISEAAHSGTDLIAALLTFFAVGVAVRPADPGHQYGHGKAEHLAALAEGAILVLASVFIMWRAIVRLVDGGMPVNATWYALLVMGIVICIDLARTTASWRAARAYSSPALSSNALHFGSDLAGSVAVLVGLLLVRGGYPRADAVAALHPPGEHGEVHAEALEGQRHSGLHRAGCAPGEVLLREPQLEPGRALAPVRVVHGRDPRFLGGCRLLTGEQVGAHALLTVPNGPARAERDGERRVLLVEQRGHGPQRVEFRPGRRLERLAGGTQAVDLVSRGRPRHPADPYRGAGQLDRSRHRRERELEPVPMPAGELVAGSL